MSIDTAIPIEEIGAFNPPAAVGVDLAIAPSTNPFKAISSGRGFRVAVEIDNLSGVPCPAELMEFVLFHVHQLSGEIKRRMS